MKLGGGQQLIYGREDGADAAAAGAVVKGYKLSWCSFFVTQSFE